MKIGTKPKLASGNHSTQEAGYQLQKPSSNAQDFYSQPQFGHLSKGDRLKTWPIECLEASSTLAKNKK